MGLSRYLGGSESQGVSLKVSGGEEGSKRLGSRRLGIVGFGTEAWRSVEASESWNLQINR